MAKKKAKKPEAGSEVWDNPEVLADQLTKTEKFLEENKNLVFIAGGVIILIVAGILGYRYYVNSQNEIALSEMYQAEIYFQNDSLDLALTGDGNSYGFLDVIEDYGLTKAANLAHYYAGVCYLKKGNFNAAIDHLEDFGSSDIILQGKAYALTGDAHMELGDIDEAISSYKQAADYKKNEFFTPTYLTKLAVAYEQNGDYQKAIDAYDKS